MAGENTVDINVKADTKAAQGELDKLAQKSKSSKQKIVGDFNDAARAAKNFRKALSAITTGAFILNGVESAVNLIDRMTSSARKAREEAEKLAQAQAKALDAQRVREMAAAYKELEGSIAAAAVERRRANEIEDLETAAKREGEDLEMEAAREGEIAALDPSDPLYDRKKAQIEAKFSAQGATVKATRAKEDAERASRREEEEAVAKAEEAGRRAFALNDDRARLGELRERQRKASLRSETENEYDAHGFWSSFGNNARAIVEGIGTGDFSRYGSDRTKHGDKAREAARAEAEDLQRQIDELEAQIKAKEQGIADLNAESAQAAAKSAIYSVKGDKAGQALETARSSGARAVAAADRARAEEEARRASALAASGSLADERDRIKARIAAEQERKDAAGMAVYQAQGAYDAARISGNRAAQQSAFSNLQSAQNAAQDVNHAADSAINALTETLKSVEARLKAAQSELKKQAGQSNYAWNESPSGD